MEQIYIYVGEDYGADPYLTTLPLFQAVLTQLFKDEGWGPLPELTERDYSVNKVHAPVVVDEDNNIVLLGATLENVGERGFLADPYNLLGWAIAQDLERLIRGHCGEGRGVGFGELRRAVEMVEEVTANA